MSSTSSETIAIFAPATVANLGPGYDVLGLALEEPGDTVTLTRTERPGARLQQIIPYGDETSPPANENNTASVAARLTLERLEQQLGLSEQGLGWGVEMKLDKGMPVSSGLGSSGASAVAAAVGVNTLAGGPLDHRQLIEICAAAEGAACGSAHADNVTPGIVGGIALIRPDGEPVSIETKLDLHLALVTPFTELSTRKARGVLPKSVPIKELVHNSAHLASVVYALATGDAELLGRSIYDRVAEPRRGQLISGFREVQAAARKAGALGCSISGAGPSIFAICLGTNSAQAASKAMSSALDSVGIEHRAWTSPLRRQGAGPLR